METIKRCEKCRELYQVVYKFIVRFNGVVFPCFGVSEVRIMAGPDGKPYMAPFTVRAAMLPGKKTLAEVIQEAGVKEVEVEVIQLTQGAEQRITRTLVYPKCDLVYTMDKHQADENELMWETVLVTPDEIKVSHDNSGRLLDEWLEEEEKRLAAEAEEGKEDGSTEE